MTVLDATRRSRILRSDARHNATRRTKQRFHLLKAAYIGTDLGRCSILITPTNVDSCRSRFGILLSKSLKYDKLVVFNEMSRNVLAAAPFLMFQDGVPRNVLPLRSGHNCGFIE